MSSAHLALSSTAQQGAIVLFDHDPVMCDTTPPHIGFSLFGLAAAEANHLLFAQ